MAPDRLFAFSIPLIPRHRAKNWQLVLDNLQATLQSMLNQFDRNFVILLASTDELDLPELSHRQVVRVALRENYASHLQGNSHRDQLSDAGIKRRYNLNAARELGVTYFMHADADDLISNRLVEHVRHERHPIGYAVSQGLILDSRVGKFLMHPGPYSQGPSFSNTCGTSIIYNLDFKGSADPDWPNANFLAPYGMLSPPLMIAPIVRRYMHDFGIRQEHMGRVAIAARAADQ